MNIKPYTPEILLGKVYQLVGRNGVDDVTLCGSRAIDLAREDSDFDIVVWKHDITEPQQPVHHKEGDVHLCIWCKPTTMFNDKYKGLDFPKVSLISGIMTQNNQEDVITHFARRAEIYGELFFSKRKLPRDVEQKIREKLK